MFELFIAIRHIKERRRQTLLSISAVAIAIAILVITQGMMNGYNYLLLNKTVDNLPHITVLPRENEKYIYLYQTIITKIDSIEGVVAISPHLNGQAHLKYKNYVKTAIFQGINPNLEDRVIPISGSLIEGSLDSLLLNPNAIIIGDGVANNLHVKTGDILSVSFPNANTMNLKVVGIVDTGTPIDDVIAYTSLKTAQRFYDAADVVNGLLVRIADPRKARNTASEIALETDLQAKSWMETNPEIMQSLTMENISNSLVMGLILLVACAGILTTIVMVVMEKMSEIGILMAMGSAPNSIKKIFLLESSLLGLIGAIIGSILGYIAATSIGEYTYEVGITIGTFKITSIPVFVNPSDILIFVLLTFLINLLAGLYPASKAANLDPVEAIRSI